MVTRLPYYFKSLFGTTGLPGTEHIPTSNDSAEVQQKVVVTAKPKLCVRNVNKFGLWRNEQHVMDDLAKLKTKTCKLHALKVQLDFIPKVLKQCPADKSIFDLSKNKKSCL